MTCQDFDYVAFLIATVHVHVVMSFCVALYLVSRRLGAFAQGLSRFQRWAPRASEPSLRIGELGGGTNPCDVGLDLSGSWQQGHSATYNAPSRI
jgi:hypothetical protein